MCPILKRQISKFSYATNPATKYGPGDGSPVHSCFGQNTWIGVLDMIYVKAKI